jgi:hypothetical protein
MNAIALLAVLWLAPCDATPPDTRLPVVAPMFGSDPVWMVDAGLTIGDTPNKTIWVVSRAVSGTLTVSGRRLDGPGVPLFQSVYGEPLTNVLVVDNPPRKTMIPGGASREIMASYSFVHGNVVYPSAGCWEFTATIGERVVRIVRELKR